MVYGPTSPSALKRVLTPRCQRKRVNSNSTNHDSAPIGQPQAISQDQRDTQELESLGLERSSYFLDVAERSGLDAGLSGEGDAQELERKDLGDRQTDCVVDLGEYCCSVVGVATEPASIAAGSLDVVTKLAV